MVNKAVYYETIKLVAESYDEFSAALQELADDYVVANKPLFWNNSYSAILIKKKLAGVPEPESGAEVNGVVYDTIEEALTAALESETPVEIKLFEDVDFGAAPFIIPAGKDITLDLNGKAVTSDQTGSKTSTIKNTGNLTIVDGKEGGVIVGSKRAVSTAEGGKTVVESGTFTSGNCAFEVLTGGELVINDANVTAQEFGVIVFSGGKLTVNGGDFTCIDNAVLGTDGTAGRGNNEIVVNGGTFNGNIVSSGYIACGIYLANNDTLVVNDGTFNIENGCGILVRSGSATIAEGVEINVSGDTTGLVGDSRVQVPCKEIVLDKIAGYPGGEPSVINNTAYEVTEIVA